MLLLLAHIIPYCVPGESTWVKSYYYANKHQNYNFQIIGQSAIVYRLPPCTHRSGGLARESFSAECIQK